MPPLRRYLRITRYSVLECRIYLDNPADINRWLLNSRSPVLPRVIEAVRPLVLPKLREENARVKVGRNGAKGKGKGRGWKDVVVEDDFEVAIFLTETSTRHSILRKEKRVKTPKARLGTRQGRLTGTGSREEPLVEAETEAGDGDEEAGIVGLRREESQEEGTGLGDIRFREPMSFRAGEGENDEEQGLFLPDSSETQSPPSKRAGEEGSTNADDKDEEDDKKKMALDTTYDGFSIYGRILCLVVKRRGNTTRAGTVAATGVGTGTTVGNGKAMMEEWITSTQVGEGRMGDD